MSIAIMSAIPVIHREQEKLDGNPDNRRGALIFSEVLDLNPEMIPLFVAGVSEAIETNPSKADGFVLFFEALARAHGPKIAPHIKTVMSAVMRILSTSSGSCSRAVAAIAQHGIDPLASGAEKRAIFHSICKPLSDALMSFDEHASAGAAACLRHLVNQEVWRFASNETVNEVCLKVTAALEEARSRTSSHLALATALAEHNIPLLEAYARPLLRTGLQILSIGAEAAASDELISAIQMISFLIRRVDARSFFLEIESVLEIMGSFQNEQSPYLQAAAYDALQTASVIAAQSFDKEDLCLYEMVEGRASAHIHGFVAAPPPHLSSCQSHDSLAGSSSSTKHSSCYPNLNEESQRFKKTSIELPHTIFRNRLGESMSGTSKRSSLIDDGIMSSTSRNITASENDSNNFDSRSYVKQDCNMLSCSSSKVNAEVLPNGAGFDYGNYHKANSDKLKTRKEQLIHHSGFSSSCSELQLSDKTFLSTSSLNPYHRTTIKETQSISLGNMGFSKTQIVLFCSLAMLFLVIALLISMFRNNEALFDVFPT